MTMSPWLQDSGGTSKQYKIIQVHKSWGMVSLSMHISIESRLATFLIIMIYFGKRIISCKQRTWKRKEMQRRAKLSAVNEHGALFLGANSQDCEWTWAKPSVWVSCLLTRRKKNTSSRQCTLQSALRKAKHSSHLAKGTSIGAQDSSKVGALTVLTNINSTNMGFGA